jgi:hypothetical protein
MRAAALENAEDDAMQQMSMSFAAHVMECPELAGLVLAHKPTQVQYSTGNVGERFIQLLKMACKLHVMETAC